MKKYQPYLIFIILALGCFVALYSDLIFSPTRRIVLFFVLAVVPALLFGSEATARFELKLPGYVFAVTGSGAIFFGAIYLMDHLAKPEERIAVYYFIDENGQNLLVDADGILEVKQAEGGLTVTQFVDGNTCVLIFPEQVEKVPIEVRKFPQGRVYRTELSYVGTRTSYLQLGKDLK